jgi:hypothetical protein
MPRCHPWLPRDEDGRVSVEDLDTLARVLAHEGQDLSCDIISFSCREWSDADEDERAKIWLFLGDAVTRVVAAGLLPPPSEPVPPFGTRVEAMVVGGKPGPACKYGVGIVKGQEWDSVFRVWRR